jgi:hypothetical protein
MKTKVVFKLLLTALLLSGCQNPVWDDSAQNWNREHPTHPLRFAIANAHFEKSINFDSPDANSTWLKQGWRISDGLYVWARNIGRFNSGGVSLEAGGGIENDIAITQTIRVDPTKFYRLSAWVKTENVVGGTGANICLYNTWISSGQLVGTNDWQRISFDFTPPPTGEITIACRLGYWAAVSTGKAYFDDVVIERIPKYIQEGDHIKLILDRDDVSGVKPQTIKSWVRNLDHAYEKYAELMGLYPYSQETISIASVNTYPGGWAVAGNPILWYKPYINQELKDIQNTGSWSFGIMHELAHDFVGDNTNHSWIWNEEMFANLRMFYVVEELNAPILISRLYIGSELANFYKTDGGDSYEKWIGQGIPKGHDGLMYTLIRIKDQVGWQPFKDTYEDLNASAVNPATGWEKFNLFLDKLTQYSGQDVRLTYPAGELDVIRQLFNQ